MGVIAIKTVISKAAELATKTKDTIGKATPPPIDDLRNKHRWYQCTIKNCTQFPLLLEEVYFYKGKWWTAPGDVQKFEQIVFSACNKDRSPTGASGGISFRLKLDQDQYFDIAVGLSSPDLGERKAGVIESRDPEDGYNVASAQGNAMTSKNEYRAKDGDNPDQDVRIEFRVSAQFGQDMLIVVTQVRL